MEPVPVGKLIDEGVEAFPDAIHIAIAPVRAFDTLIPGQGIGFHEDGNTELVSHNSKKIIGIVDPFLEKPVQGNQRCYMWLFPNTIQSLRHVWTHPEFEACIRRGESAAKRKSRAWVEDFASRVSLDYDKLMKAAEDFQRNGAYLRGGSNLEGEWVPDEFWDHYMILTGKVVGDDNRGNFFTCSC